jgi:hypothetical protein
MTFTVSQSCCRETAELLLFREIQGLIAESVLYFHR